MQEVPAAVEQAGAGDAAAQENRLGPRFEARQRIRRLAADDSDLRDTQRRGVAGDDGATAGVALDGNGARLAASAGAIAANGAQPLDRDRAGTGAHIPQYLARQRSQRGDGHGANLALGELAVVLEQLVRQAGYRRYEACGRSRPALDGERVEVGGARMRPVFGHAIEPPLPRPPQVLEHGEGARPEASLREQRRR